MLCQSSEVEWEYLEISVLDESCMNSLTPGIAGGVQVSFFWSLQDRGIEAVEKI